MRVKAPSIGLFLAGVLTPFALAGRPADAGHGNGHTDAPETATVTVTVTTTTTTASVPLVICHRQGPKTDPYVKIKVPADLVWTRVKHGDVLPSATGGCPSSDGSNVAKGRKPGR